MQFSNKRILLLGFTVPEKTIDWICQVDRIMPVQTHKFAWSLVRGLEAHGANVDLLSSEPVSNYPINPNLYFPYKKWFRSRKSWNVILPFVNVLGLKHLTRFLSGFCLLVMWLFLTRSATSRTIIVHGVHSPFLYASLLAGKISGIKVVTVVTDPPGVVLPGENFVKRFLRYCDKTVIVFALRFMDGLTVLTRQLSDDLAPKVPSVVVEGMICTEGYTTNDDFDNMSVLGTSSDFVVLYAGLLRKEYGLDLLLKGFSKLKDPSFKLYILGKGDYEAEIKQASMQDSRIVFKGYCTQDEIKKLYKKATVLVNPRPTDQGFTKYSFPSKTIEYMVSGTPVITTKLPGIPEEYFDFLFVIDEESPEGLASLFEQIRNMPKDIIFNLCRDAKKFILDNKTEFSQGKRILDFLNKI